MSRKLLKTEKKMSREEVGEKLHHLADKIAEGQLELTAGNDSVTLRPTDQVEFELEVEKETDGDLSIEIDIEWPESGNSEEIEIQ